MYVKVLIRPNCIYDILFSKFHGKDTIIIIIKLVWIKMKRKQYHTGECISRSNIKIVERGKIDTTNTQLLDNGLFWLATCTSLNIGGVKLV
jgi:hypothetical protein